ncbi:hypothetical protein EV424DRAFT_552465 [Suillus variegatus]|nr:hypothetical protein EV424DRAFT_552465 [Suillus variegatus]
MVKHVEISSVHYMLRLHRHGFRWTSASPQITLGLEYAEHMGINNRSAENLLACSSSTQEGMAFSMFGPLLSTVVFLEAGSCHDLWRHFLEGFSLEDINTTFGDEVAVHFSNLRDYSPRNYKPNKGRYLTQRVHGTTG